MDAGDRYLMFYKVFIAIKHHTRCLNSAFLFIRLKVLRNVSRHHAPGGESISFLCWSSVCVCVCLFLSEPKWSSRVAECVILTDKN